MGCHIINSKQLNLNLLFWKIHLCDFVWRKLKKVEDYKLFGSCSWSSCFLLMIILLFHYHIRKLLMIILLFQMLCCDQSERSIQLMGFLVTKLSFMWVCMDEIEKIWNNWRLQIISFMWVCMEEIEKIWKNWKLQIISFMWAPWPPWPWPMLWLLCDKLYTPQVMFVTGMSKLHQLSTQELLFPSSQ